MGKNLTMKLLNKLNKTSKTITWRKFDFEFCLTSIKFIGLIKLWLRRRAAAFIPWRGLESKFIPKNAFFRQHSSFLPLFSKISQNFSNTTPKNLFSSFSLQIFLRQSPILFPIFKPTRHFRSKGQRKALLKDQDSRFIKNQTNET